MSGGISIHVVDVSRGVPAAGMQVELIRLDPERALLAHSVVGANGVLELPRTISETPQTAGLYEAVFHVGAYYRARNVELPSRAFLERVPYVFGVADPTQHYHLPMKVTPWGFSLFRGGA